MLSTLHLFHTCSLSCVTPIDELFIPCYWLVLAMWLIVKVLCTFNALMFPSLGGSFLLKLAPLPHPFQARQLVWISLMISLMQADSQDCSLSCPSASFFPHGFPGFLGLIHRGADFIPHLLGFLNFHS